MLNCQKYYQNKVDAVLKDKDDKTEIKKKSLLLMNKNKVKYQLITKENDAKDLLQC